MEHLAEIVIAFIQAETWADSKSYLEQHPELLSPEADQAIEVFLQFAQTDCDEDLEVKFEVMEALLSPVED